MIVLFLMLGALAQDIKAVSVTYDRFVGSNRFLELPNEEVKDRLNLNLNINVVGPFYWDNNIFMLTTPGRVAWVGYQFEVGFHIKTIDVFFHHVSQHALDNNPAFGFFPVNDSIAIRWNIK